jgi:hypothetical protein
MVQSFILYVQIGSEVYNESVEVKYYPLKSLQGDMSAVKQ